MRRSVRIIEIDTPTLARALISLSEAKVRNQLRTMRAHLFSHSLMIMTAASTSLNLDGNKFSSTTSQFIPKPVHPLNKKAMDETRLNMRGSHFSVGVNSDNHMQPAPYKVSNPDGAELVKPIDGAALRKESWILGQCPDTYHSI